MLTASTTDVLSHVAIRARSQKVQLALPHAWRPWPDADPSPPAKPALQGCYVRAQHAAFAMQVLLATCFDDTQLQELKGLEGQYVRLDMDPLGNVSATAMEASQCEMWCKGMGRPQALVSLYGASQSKHTRICLAAHIQGHAETKISIMCVRQCPGLGDADLLMSGDKPKQAVRKQKQRLLARLQSGWS